MNDEEIEQESQNNNSSNLAKKKLKRMVVIKFGLPILIAALITLMCFLLLILASQGEESCYTNDSNIGGGNTIAGDWKDPNSQVHKDMQYAVDQFKTQAGMSGDNIAAPLAIGLRESQFNPKAVNPGGQVKGIWQWGTGGVNGNRYGNTEDTVESQVALAIRELKTSHVKTLTDMKDADLNGSLDSWDINFEGLGVGDPQRKVEQIRATAKEVKEVFNLNFEGNINTGDGDIDQGNSPDSTTCDSGGSGTASGMPINGDYNITGGYPDYNGDAGAEHYGVDFQTVNHSENGEESNVYSVSDGTVVVKQFDPVGGNHVVIKDGSGKYIYYGHAPSLDSIVVSEGDKIKKGQHITHEGQTGLATGIHVHVGVNTMNQFGFGPHSAGIISPAKYLKFFPAEATKSGGILSNDGPIVVPAGPFHTEDKNEDNTND